MTSWIFLAIGLAIGFAAAVGLIVVPRRARAARASRPRPLEVQQQPGVTLVSGPTTTDPNYAAEDNARLWLTPLEDPAFPNVYIAQGSTQDLAVLGGHPLSLAGDIGKTLAATNVAAQTAATAGQVAQVASQSAAAANTAAQQSVALYRLGDKTAAALRSGSTFMRSAESGSRLGVYVSESTHQVEGLVDLVPVGQSASVAAAGSRAAAVASGVANVANAIAMASMQLQLEAISKQLAEVNACAKRIEEFQELEQRCRIDSGVHEIETAYQQAIAAGAVSNKIFQPIAELGTKLDADVRHLSEQCERRLGRLAGMGTQQDRLDWLETDGMAAVRDLISLLVASRAWAMQQTLYIGNLLERETDSDELHEAHKRAAQKKTESIRVRLAETSTTASRLAYETGRILDLAEQAPGKVTVKERLARPTRQQRIHERTTTRSEHLKELLASAQVPVPAVPSLPFNLEEIGTDDQPTEASWRKLLTLILDPAESLQLIVYGKGVGANHNLSGKKSVLVFTDRRVIAIRRKDFERAASVRLSTSLETVQQASANRAYRGHVLRLTMKHGVTLPFGSGALDIRMNEADAIGAATRINALINDRESRRTAPIGPGFAPTIEGLLTGPEEALPELTIALNESTKRSA